MARPKKTQKRAKKTTARGKVKPKSANKGKAAKQPKGLRQSKRLQQPKGLQTITDNIIIRRPSPNPQPDIELINMITTDLHSIMEALDEFAANLRALDRCRKAKGFSAWSLRYAQTPHIIRGVLPKAKLLSYPA